jgi:NitT/TauT family transport system substrate-binding protein
MRLPLSRTDPAPATGGRHKRHGIGPIIGAVAVVLLAAGCHVAGGGSGGSSGDMSITVAALPGVDDAPLYLGVTDGAFRKAGVQVTVKTYDTSKQTLAALNSGSAQVAVSDYADFFYAESVQPGLRIVSDGYDGSPNVMEVLAEPSSGITTPQDLSGKTIGTPESQEFPFSPDVPYSMETLATQAALLENYGVEPTSVTWKPMPAQNLAGALASGQVNAILATEPDIFQAESQDGAAEVMDSLNGITASLPLAGYVTTSSDGSKDASALHAFQSALTQAQIQAAGGVGVRSVLAHYSGMNTQTADMVTLGVYPTSANSGGIQRVVDLMYNFSMLGADINVSSLIYH